MTPIKRRKRQKFVFGIVFFACKSFLSSLHYVRRWWHNNDDMNNNNKAHHLIQRFNSVFCMTLSPSTVRTISRPVSRLDF